MDRQGVQGYEEGQSKLLMSLLEELSSYFILAVRAGRGCQERSSRILTRGDGFREGPARA